MINSSSTYSQFFAQFRKLIEDQLSLRIKSGKLKLHLKELKMDRSRRFQLIEILRRVKTKEMAKLKFISNFGVSVDVNSLLLRKVFFADLKRVNELLDAIPNHEFLHLFVYVTYCDNLLHGKEIHQDKTQISVNMLKDYFDTHPDIYKNFYPKDEEVDEQYQEEEQKQSVGIIKKSTVITKGNGLKKNQQIDTQDIYEFPSMNPATKKAQAQSSKPAVEPSLPVEKPKNEKEIQKKLNQLSNWEKANENPFLYESQDTKIRVTQVLKEEFPTLGGGKLQPFTIPKKKHHQFITEEEKPKPKQVSAPKPANDPNQWNGPGSESVDQHDIANLKVVGVKKKNKGGQMQVSLAGYFK